MIARRSGRSSKIEDCNRDRKGNQQRLYGLAVSAKRYVVYTRRKKSLIIIKPSEHGLGMVFVPDTGRYKPQNCLDQETDICAMDRRSMGSPARQPLPLGKRCRECACGSALVSWDAASCHGDSSDDTECDGGSAEARSRSSQAVQLRNFAHTAGVTKGLHSGCSVQQKHKRMA